MINMEDRAMLKKMIKTGDIPRAAAIYEQKAGRKISESLLHFFIKGLKPFNGRPGAHQPDIMFAAIYEAIKERKIREERCERLVAEVRQATGSAAAAAAIS